MHSASLMASEIGTHGLLQLDGLQVLVEIVDMRSRFGQVDALVRPVGGQGEKWVEARRITIQQ